MLDYTIRVGDWFDGTGDAIISFSVKGLEGQTGDTPLTLAASFSGSQAVTLILTSGVLKQRYTFTAEITTRMGLVYAVPLTLQIDDNSPATAPRSFEVPSVPVDADSFKALIKMLPTSPPTVGELWNNAGGIFIVEED